VCSRELYHNLIHKHYAQHSFKMQQDNQHANFQYAKGGPLHDIPTGPALLNREETLVDGLAFIGLSLTQNSERGHSFP
jgi:hypothetical protein